MKWFAVVACLVLIAPVVMAQDAAIEELSLNQAIDFALKNNLSIQIETYNPEVRDTNIRFEQSRFEPLFSSLVNYEDQTIPTGSLLVGTNQVQNQTYVYNFSFQQLLKTGTSYSVGFNNGRNETNQLFTSVNPRFDSSLFAGITQPLMRNFGKEITLTPLKIVTQNRIASDYRLQQRIADIALQVEQTYWDLVFGRGQLDVVKQALATAKDLYESNKKQVEVGTMAPLEIVVAEAEVAQREEQIIVAESFIQNTEDRLRALMYGSLEASGSLNEIIPVDKPDVREVTMSYDEAIQRALVENPDLKALQADLDSRKLNVKLQSNALKPQFDFRASLGGNGLGGDRLIFGGDDPFNPIIIGTDPGGYGDALSNLWDNSTFSFGFVIGIPIGNGTARANYVRADLQEKQAGKIVEDARHQLSINVRIAVRNLENSLKALDAARASRVLQEKKLDAEKKKLAVGLSTNHVVLDFTSDLAEAQSGELQALVTFNKNVAQLKRYFGTVTK